MARGSEAAHLMVLSGPWDNYQIREILEIHKLPFYLLSWEQNTAFFCYKTSFCMLSKWHLRYHIWHSHYFWIVTMILFYGYWWLTAALKVLPASNAVNSVCCNPFMLNRQICVRLFWLAPRWRIVGARPISSAVRRRARETSGQMGWCWRRLQQPHAHAQLPVRYFCADPVMYRRTRSAV